MSSSELASVFTSQITAHFSLQDQSVYAVYRNSRYLLSESAKHLNTLCGKVQFLNLDLSLSFERLVTYGLFVVTYECNLCC